MLSASAYAAFTEAGPAVVTTDASFVVARGRTEREVPFHSGEVWTGTYYCAQGITDLDLEIEEVNGNEVQAIFSFAARGSGATGRFDMNGTYQPSSRHLTLSAGDWISQPLGYQTVDLDGNLDAGGALFTGRVLGPGCSVFSVRRK